jgi:hypothetical protein
MKLKMMAALLVVATFSSAAIAQAPVPPPSPSATADAKTRFWMLDKEMVWTIGNTEDSITIPAGFVTDYASIPQALWSFGLSPYDQYSRAAVIHDYLYWTQVCTKPQSDRLLLIAMKESDVGKFDEFAVYSGVVLGGQSSWDANTKERKDGWPRIAPAGKRQLPSNGLWGAHRAKLRAEGVRDPELAKNPSFCKYGDSTDVPNIVGSPPSPKQPLSPQADISRAGSESLPNN